MKVLNADRGFLTIDGNTILMTNFNMDFCECGEDAEIATHGFLNGEPVDQYMCKKCYNKKDEK